MAQARDLIQHIQIRIYPTEVQPESRPVAVRAFASVKDAGARDYVPMLVVMRNPKLREQLLAQAREEIRRWQATYGHLVEFAAIVRAIKQTISIP